MDSTSPLPDNVPEVASIRISIGLAEDGQGTGWSVDGMSDEAAIGYLTSITDLLRAKVAHAWRPENEEVIRALEDVIVECDSCGHHFPLTAENIISIDGEEED
jgi:hypothetical protein